MSTDKITLTVAVKLYEDDAGKLAAYCEGADGQTFSTVKGWIDFTEGVGEYPTLAWYTTEITITPPAHGKVLPVDSVTNPKAVR